MKFRAVISEPQIIKEFYNLILTLSKLTKECIMTINKNYIQFIINEESCTSAPLVWIEIQNSSYFNEYTMSGINDKYENILLSFNPSNLSRALQVLRNPVTFLKMKLTNKQFACLTIEIELPLNNNIQNRLIIHDVPTIIIPVNDWDIYKLPYLPNSQIHIILSNLRFLKNLIDKLKNFTPSITFCGTNSGELSIISETDQATVATHFQNLHIKFNQNNDNDNNQKNIETSCSVDCKKMALFLSALQFPNLELCFSILQDHLIKIEIEFPSTMQMMCVIPAICI